MRSSRCTSRVLSLRRGTRPRTGARCPSRQMPRCSVESSTRAQRREFTATWGKPTTAPPRAGIATFTIIAARELGRFGVTVNAISPSAYTRMTDYLREYTEEEVEVRDPRWVSPTVVYLASDEAQGHHRAGHPGGRRHGRGVRGLAPGGRGGGDGRPGRAGCQDSRDGRPGAQELGDGRVGARLRAHILEGSRRARPYSLSERFTPSRTAAAHSQSIRPERRR